VRTLGVDLASAVERTGMCLVEWDVTQARIVELAVGADDDRVMTEHERADVTGIDCPFGWPVRFQDLVTGRAPAGEWSPALRDELR
jgi:predicted nuclease with RNAse H fold